MLAALILGHAIAYGPPADCRCQCDCPPEAPREDIHLGGDFFVGEGGVGPAFAPPIYGGTGVVFVEGSEFAGGFARAGAFASASASASASARASASVSVRIVGGARPSHPGGGHKGGKY